TFLVALYLIFDALSQSHLQPRMPACGGPEAQMSDSEVLCLGLAVQWRSGVPWQSERGIMRYGRKHLRPLCPPVLPQSAFNRRVRRLWGAFLLIQDAVAEQRAHGEYDVMDGFPMPVAHGARAFNPGWWAAMARSGTGGNDRYGYGVRMRMVSNPNGVATGWALASGNVQERGVAEWLCSPRAGVPGVHGPLDDKGHKPTGPPRGVAGSRAAWRGRGTQAHPERWRLAWGRWACALGARLRGPGLPASHNSASCPSTLVAFGPSGGRNDLGTRARELWAHVSGYPQHVGAAEAGCGESGGVSSGHAAQSALGTSGLCLCHPDCIRQRICIKRLIMRL